MDIKITTKLPFYSIGFVGLFLAFFLQEVSAQSRIVVLKEQQSQQTIPYANVIFDNSGFGTYSNHLGVFTVPETIQSLRTSATLVITYDAVAPVTFPNGSKDTS